MINTEIRISHFDIKISTIFIFIAPYALEPNKNRKKDIFVLMPFLNRHLKVKNALGFNIRPILSASSLHSVFFYITYTVISGV